MRESFKSAIIVAFITILIWFAADQNVKERADFSIPVRVVSGDPDRYVAIAEPPYQRTISVVMNARRKHLKEFDDLVNSKTLFEATLHRTEEASSEPRPIPVSEILGQIKELSEYGLEYVESVDPPALSVIIDDYVTVTDVRVEPQYGDLRVTANPTPPTVSVRLPAFVADQLRVDPVAVADAEQRIRAASKPDGSFQVKVPLSFRVLKGAPPDLRISILPAAEVTITGQIESLAATKRKGPIQITWSIPDRVQRDFRIVVDPASNFRPDIDVTGPKDLIDQLDPRDIRAFVDVLAADAEKPGTKIRRAAQFILPPGFTLAAGSQPYELVFELQPISQDPAMGED